jgi:hypothetical protein
MKTKVTYRYWPLCLLFVLFFHPDVRAQKVFTLTSPDKNSNLKVYIDKMINYELSFKNQTILFPSVIGMEFENYKVPGDSPRVKSSKKREVNETIYPLYGKFSRLQNNFNELRIDFHKNYALIFRLFDEGLAYRFETRFPEEVKVITELSEYNFPLDPMVTAKRKGKKWHIGALNNWTERDVAIDFSFLPGGDYKARIFRDGVNANKVASDYKVEDINFSPEKVLKLTLASGGGAVIRIVPEK